MYLIMSFWWTLSGRTISSLCSELEEKLGGEGNREGFTTLSLSLEGCRIVVVVNVMHELVSLCRLFCFSR